jgi:hypothetical protein
VLFSAADHSESDRNKAVSRRVVLAVDNYLFMQNSILPELA